MTKAEYNRAAEKQRWEEFKQRKADYAKKLIVTPTHSNQIELAKEERKKEHNYALDAVIHNS